MKRQRLRRCLPVTGEALPHRLQRYEESRWGGIYRPFSPLRGWTNRFRSVQRSMQNVWPSMNRLVQFQLVSDHRPDDRPEATHCGGSRYRRLTVRYSMVGIEIPPSMTGYTLHPVKNEEKRNRKKSRVKSIFALLKLRSHHVSALSTRLSHF